MSRDVKEWFRNEVHFWRCLKTVEAVLTLQVLLTPVALFALDFSILCPLDGIEAWLTSLTTGRTIWHHICFLAVGFLLSTYHVTTVDVAPVVHTTRLAHVLHFANLRSVGQAVLRALGGATFVWSLLGISRGSYAQLKTDCESDSDEPCLNEAHMFLVLHGAFTSVSLHLAQLADRGLAFPPIQVASVRAHLRIGSVVRQAAWGTLNKVHYFLVLYLALGSYPKEWIGGADDPRLWVGNLQSVSGLLDLRLLWALVVTGSALRALDRLAVQLRDYFLTKTYQFPVAIQYEADRVRQLTTVMASRNCAFLQYLGFQDLQHLAQHSPGRRAQVFAISTPGCHPLYWPTLCKECLDLVAQFSHALVQLEGPPPSPPAPVATPQSPKTPSSLHMRRLAPPTSPLSPGAMPPVPPAAKVTLLDRVVAALSQKPLVAYFISELPDVKSRQLFAGCQPLIWAVEGLCLLVCASRTEDMYGVVQFSLASIFNSLLELDQLLERQGKRCLRRPAHNSGSGRELRLGRSLAAAVSTGLYQMADTFLPHLKSLDLTAENRRRLNQFVDFNR